MQEIEERVRRLRADHPTVAITSVLVHADERLFVVSASVMLNEGGSAVALGSATRDEGVEAAETRALSRVLARLGFAATAAAEPAQEPAAPVAPPMEDARAEIESPPARPGNRLSMPSERAEPAEPVAPPRSRATTSAERPAPAAQRPQPAAPADEPLQPAARPTQRPAAATSSRMAPERTDRADDPPLEDYSWTAFWQWARKLGYESKGSIEGLIGESMTPLSPAEVRDRIRAARDED